MPPEQRYDSSYEALELDINGWKREGEGNEGKGVERRESLQWRGWRGPMLGPRDLTWAWRRSDAQELQWAVIANPAVTST